MTRIERTAINYISDKIYNTALTVFLFFLISSNAFSQAPNITYATPQTYKVNTAITPLAPTNTGGAVPAAEYGQVSKVTNGGFNTITSVAPYGTDVVYACDWGNNLVKKVDVATGAVNLFVGSGRTGADDGSGYAASFNEPDGMVLDPAGNIYIADQGNNMIRKVTPAGVVTTLAGNGNFGSADGAGNVATFNTPRGLTIDPAGNIYVADQGNNSIRKITPEGVVSTIIGQGGIVGQAALLNTPTAVTIDAAGNLYISDSGNNAIKKLTPTGNVSTLATGINFPRELRVDGLGNCYVAEQFGNSVKKISSAGQVTVLASGGLINGPLGLAFDGSGNIYLGNNGGGNVLKISISGYTIDKALPPGLSFDKKTGIISGTPTASWPLTDYTVTAYNGGGSSTTVVKIQVLAANVLLPSYITFPGIDINNIVDNEVDPKAYSTNKETPITYTSDNPAVATVAPDGLLYITGPGTSQITGHQEGNANYSAAQPVTVTLTITVTQKIDFSAIPAKQICSGDFQASASPHDYGFPLSGVPITYSSSNTSVATVSAIGLVHIVGKGTTVITADQASAPYYTAAPSVSQTLIVTTPVVPEFTVVASSYTACEGSSLTFTAKVNNLGVLVNPSYQWQLNGVNVGTNSNMFDAALARTDNLSCTVTNNDGCHAQSLPKSISGDILAHLTPLTISISSSQSTPVCSGELIKFTAKAGTVAGINSYQWKVNGSDVGTDNPEFSSTTFADGDVVTCTITNTGALCLVAPAVTSNALTTAILYPDSPAPAVSITASANNVYVGTAITFTATPSNTTGEVTYQWKLNGTDAGTNSSTFSSQQFADGDKVTCTILNGSCNAPAVSEQITLTILPPIVVAPPNTFTPNGDGVNDLWDITGLSVFQNSTINVYSRYGELLYHSKGYSIPWDGFYKGQNLPAATYYYMIDLGNGRPLISGYVAIIR